MNRSKAAWPDAFRQGRDYGAGADFSAVAEATCLIQSRRVKPVRPFDHETASSTPGHDTVQHAGMGNATGFALAHVMGQDRYSSPRAADEICDRNRYLDLLLQLKPTAAQEELSTWHGRIAARKRSAHGRLGVEREQALQAGRFATAVVGFIPEQHLKRGVEQFSILIQQFPNVTCTTRDVVVKGDPECLALGSRGNDEYANLARV